MKKNKGFVSLVIFALFALLALLIGGIVYYNSKNMKSVKELPNKQHNVQTKTETETGASKSPLGFNVGEPPVTVYKTTKDYSKLVSVGLSSDNSKVISYPGTRDISLQRPTALHGSYYTGGFIGHKTAFLNISIDEYINSGVDLGNKFSLDEIYAKIVDKNPFLEMYSCPGIFLSDPTFKDKLNSYIDNNQLPIKCDRWI